MHIYLLNMQNTYNKQKIYITKLVPLYSKDLVMFMSKKQSWKEFRSFHHVMQSDYMHTRKCKNSAPSSNAVLNIKNAIPN